MNDDDCVHCGDAFVGDLVIELPNGDRIHRHCEKDYEEAQNERAHEALAADFSGAEYDAQRFGGR